MSNQALTETTEPPAASQRRNCAGHRHGPIKDTGCYHMINFDAQTERT